MEEIEDISTNSGSLVVVVDGVGVVEGAVDGVLGVVSLIRGMVTKGSLL